MDDASYSSEPTTSNNTNSPRRTDSSSSADVDESESFSPRLSSALSANGGMSDDTEPLQCGSVYSQEGRRRRGSARGRFPRHGIVNGFGSSQPRLEIFPSLDPLTRTAGTTTFGNGRVQLASLDPLWGVTSPSPDYLNKSGAFKAAAPREGPKDALYVDVEHAQEATLWRRTQAPRLHNSTHYDYSKRIASNIDPYDTASRRLRLRTLGDVAADPAFPSSVFVSKMPRADVLQRQHFVRYWGKGEEQKLRSQSAELLDVLKQSSASFTLEEPPRPSSTCSDWSKMPERFGVNLNIESQAVAKFTPSPAPPPTRYKPSDPRAPTVSEASRARLSERPGLRGGLYRDSIAGTIGFTSKTRRPFQESGEDPRSMRSYWSPLPEHVLTQRRKCQEQAVREDRDMGAIRGRLNPRLTTALETGESNGYSIRGPLLTEHTLNKWRASMWNKA